MDDLPAGVLRQRRNLMIASCVLWLLSFGGVQKLAESTTNLQAFGFTIAFARPQAIFIALWAVFFYFLVRFLVYALARQPHLRMEYRHIIGLCMERRVTGFVYRNLGMQQLDPPQLGFREMPKSWDLAKGPVEVTVTTNLPGDADRKVLVDIPRVEARLRIGFAVVRLLLFHPSITDYLFPLAFSLLIAVYAARADWGGSWLEILINWPRT